MENTSIPVDTTTVQVEFHDDNDGSVVAVQVPADTRVSEAATRAGVYIPTLCHHPRLAPAGKCGICVVSVEGGPTPTQLACSTLCRSHQNDDDSTPVMKVHVHGTVLNGIANAALHRNLQASQLGTLHNTTTQRYAQTKNHAGRSPPCGGDGGLLEIEELANYLAQSTLDTSSKSITYDPSLCIGCSRCVRACDQLQGMNVLEAGASHPAAGMAAPTPPLPTCMTTRAGRPLAETDCISCGQCTVFCPTGAIKEVDHTARVMRALLDPHVVVVLQTAPSVRVTIAEMFGGQPGDCSEGQLVGAAKAAGFRFVFDTNLAADLTIIEEANELFSRIEIAKSGSKDEKKAKPLPMFTSCCPGWINLVEQSYPELIPHLSSCRSPMGMLSSIIRHHWWPRQINILSQHGGKSHTSATDEQQQGDQSKLFVVAAMPCTAKKDEIARPQFQMANGQPETDAVLTVRELARLFALRQVVRLNDYQSFANIPELVYDNPFGESTGAGVLFGVTGGVMEAALRTAADVLSGKEIENIKYEPVRGLTGIKESTVALGPANEISLNVAVCHQMRNVREFLAQIEEGEKIYHFIEIMTCPGGCIGGGGLPQSRDEDILLKRIASIYSMDERMVKRKSHHNQAVKQLYKDFLGKPLSHTSHKLLHTRYFPRPRKRPITLKAPTIAASIDTADSRSTVYVVFGTQSGTAAQAAKEIKLDLQQFIRRSKLSPEPHVCLVAANAIHPDKLMESVSCSLGTIFVTCTFGEGEFPETMEQLWDFLGKCKDARFEKFRFAVFGLGSSMYAVDDQFNRAAKRLDKRIEEVGGDRMIEVGMGDDQHSELYRGELDKWLETLLPKLFGKKGGESSFLDPPEPLFKLALAPGSHDSNFRPLPPNYHFVQVESMESQVAAGYNRPASLFTFDLHDTGVQYDVGDHLAVLPRNPERAVDQLLSLYTDRIKGSDLLTVEAVDRQSDCPFPPVLTAKELLTQYLDICGRPSRNFLKQLFLFATSLHSRTKLRLLFEHKNLRSDLDEFDLYTATHTYVDVLSEFCQTGLPPFEYLLSVIPVICPRLYSIASSPLYRENKLDLLVVLNEWADPTGKPRVGLATQFLFAAGMREKVAVQVRTGILQPPQDTETPIIMFGLGTGVAPFRGFMQHRQKLLEQGRKLGPATLYVGYRHKNQDYYLKEDFRNWVKDGVLTDIHLAFSHDKKEERGGKLYFISDLISEKPMDLASALLVKEKEGPKDKKVHAYYCGPALGIPETIQKAMEDAIRHEKGGGLGKEDAKTLLDRMVRLEDRFHAECF
jgi:NADH-quinone oxidoreductase subunit G